MPQEKHTMIDPAKLGQSLRSTDWRHIETAGVGSLV